MTRRRWRGKDDDATGAGAEAENAEDTEEKWRWEGRGIKTEKGRNTSKSDDKKKRPPPSHPRSRQKRRRCLIRIWVISSYSWAFPPPICIHLCTRPPVPVTMNILKRMERGYRDTAATMAAVVGGTRSGILTTTAGRVGKKEGRRGRKTAEMN